MAPLSVLIGEDIGPEHLARLRREFPQVDFRFCLAAVDFTAAAPDADIMFSKSFPRAALDAARGPPPGAGGQPPQPGAARPASPSAPLSST